MHHWLVLLPLAAPAAVLNVGGQTEVRVRDPGDQVSSTELAPNAVDTSVTATAAVELRSPPYTSRVSYSPFFSINSIGRPGRNLNLAHNVTLGFAYDGPRQTISVTDSTSVGFRTFSPLVGVPADAFPGQVLPTATVGFFSTQPNATYQYRVSARHVIASGLGYTYSRALDAESSKLIPTSRGPQGVLGYRYALDKANAVGADLTAAQTTTTLPERLVDTGQPPWVKTTVLQAVAVWSRSLAAGAADNTASKSATLSLRLGVGATRTEEPGEDEWSGPSLVAGANLGGALGHTFNLGKGGTVTAALTSQFATVVDQLTGQPDQRLTASGVITWERRPFQLSFIPGVVQAFDASFNPNGSSVFGSLEGSYFVTERVYLRTGVRAARVLVNQSTALADVPLFSGTQWAGFLSVGGALEPIRL